MGDHHFACTVCGLCCTGVVPLTLVEAVEHASRFPLAMMITPMKADTKGYASLPDIGVSLPGGGKKPLMLLVTPVSFIPASSPCPQLGPDNLCTIHAHKPLRCRAMPFYAYKDEDHQLDQLSPRKGWLCDTSSQAPVVYRDRQILERTDYDRERQALADQAPVLQRYVNQLLAWDPAMQARITQAARTPGASKVVTGFVSFLRQDRQYDLVDFARQQYPVLNTWLQATAGNPKLAEYNRYYRGALADLARFVA